MKIIDIKMAMDIFEQASIKHAEATEQGDYKKGNKCYDSIKTSADFLKTNGAIEKLHIYLDSWNVGVRLWAAYYLLPINEQLGIQVLEDIAKKHGIHSLIAATTLKEWKKGKLKF